MAEPDGEHVPVFIEHSPHRVQQFRALVKEVRAAMEQDGLSFLVPRLRRSVELENNICPIQPDHRIFHLAARSASPALNTMTLAHRNAVKGGRQPVHLGAGAPQWPWFTQTLKRIANQ